MRLSKRVQQLSPSLTLAISAKAKALKLKNEDVIGLGVGEPDFNTPDHILAAAKKAMDKGHTKYTPSGGIPELKQAIINKFARDNQLQYQEKEITVTVGAKHALYNLFQVILNPGDEVIVPTPYWVSYMEQIKLAGGKPIVVEGREENQFKINDLQLKKAITKRTKAVLINSPGNPTGMIYSKEELRKTGKVCIENDLLIVSDEIYEQLIYDEKKHYSMASLGPEYYERTVVINGVSKTYAMTGWRIGYAAGPKSIIQAMTDLTSHSTSNCTSIAQYAAIAALNGPQEPVNQMKQAFKERRDFVVKRINQIGGLQCLKPMGAFYVFVNISEVLKKNQNIYHTVDDWVEALLEKEKVAVVPGPAFGSNNHIRISYASSMALLQQALDRIERFVNHDV